MKRRIFGVCFMIVLGVMCCGMSAFANSRENLITRELDRWEPPAADDLGWGSLDKTARPVLNREKRIGQALARAASGGIKTKNFCWQDVCAVGSDSRYHLSSMDVDPGRSSVSPSSFEKKSFYYEWIDPTNPRNDYSLAVEAFDYRYHEPSLMKVDGMMLGVHGSYTHRMHFNREISSFREVFQTSGINMIRWDMRYTADNNMKYRSTDTGALKGEKHSIFETRVVVGYDFPYKTKHLFTPYVGLGYWFLNDHDGRKQSTTGHWSYDREQEYWYLPVGIDYQMDFKTDWSLRLNLEYDFLIEGENKSYVCGLSSSFGIFGEDGVHKQTKGHGYRGSLKVARDVGPVELFVEPFFLIWHINDSDLLGWVNSEGTVVGYTLEPDNRTTQYGAKLGINF